MFSAFSNKQVRQWRWCSACGLSSSKLPWSNYW